MKKFLKKASVMAMAVVMVSTMLIGCGGSGGGDGAAKSNGKTLHIYAQTNGLGQDWLNNAAKAYRNETGTDVEVQFDTYISANIRATLETEQADVADLYFIQAREWTQLFQDGMLEDLTDFMEEKNDDGKSFNDRMTVTKTWAFNEAGEERQVYVPVTKAPCGIVYNKKMMSYLVHDVLGWEEGHEYPLNTKELQDIIGAVEKTTQKDDKADMFTYTQNGSKQNVKPFVWSGSTGMLEFFTYAWMDQYYGDEGWKKFYSQLENCDMLNDEGFYLIYQKMVDLLGLEEDTNGEWVSTTSVPNCVSFNHTTSQAQFLMNHAVMCPTGSWFYSEMETTIEDIDNLGFMPIPYLSDDAGNPITDDGVEMPKHEDGSYANYVRLNVADYFTIPTRATEEGKENAKDFLKFMFSEEYMVNLQNDLQAALCFEFDNSSVEKTAWLNEVETVLENSTYLGRWYGTKQQIYNKIKLYNNPTEAPFSRLSISSFGSSKKLIDTATGREIGNKADAKGIAVTENVYKYVNGNYKTAANSWPTTREWLERH